MRIWDLAPEVLCRQHLLGEHRELHAVWTIITQSKAGYCHHPEVLRWHGRLRALYNRQSALVDEMERRGYRHASPLDEDLAVGLAEQERLIDDLDRQRAILRGKGCGCKI